MSDRIAEIALGVPLDKVFSYLLPEGMEATPYLRVKVPFAGRVMNGIITRIYPKEEASEELKAIELKTVIGPVDDRVIMTPDLIKTADWMSRYYLHSPGEIFEAMLPDCVRPRRYKHPYVESGRLPELNPEQEAAFEALKPLIGSPETALLHGVTGSGKTEVYKHLVMDCLKQGRSAIVLIPEISLTPQTLERFYQAFGELVGVYHSKLSGGERFGEWMRALNGEVKVMIGPRSAVFAPVRDLGLIIIDEEHESSYKSQNAPRYHAAQVAHFRSRNEKALIVLGSATPRIESYYYAKKGEIRLVELKSRYGQRPLPEVQTLDLTERKMTEKSLISQELLLEMGRMLSEGKQSLIFLNRRGFSPVLVCGSCGHTFKCPDCSVSLTYHRNDHSLNCHHCGHAEGVPPKCPSCGSTELKDLGSGTERVEHQIEALFPKARIERMDLDTTRGKHSHEEILGRMKQGEADILIGTQMVAKGHDIAGIDLVGVILPDIILNIPDFRSSERTFVLLTQVIGRAGRESGKGRAIIQTYASGHEAVVCASRQDYQAFYGKEIQTREAFYYPPFCRLGRVVIRSKDPVVLKDWVEALRPMVSGLSRPGQPLRILGPVTCPLEKLQNYYRYHIIFKSITYNDINMCLRKIKEYWRNSKNGRHIHLELDVDPVSMV